MSETGLIEKTGWEILKGLVAGGSKKAVQKAAPVIDQVKKTTAKLSIEYNPLSLYPGDIVVLGIEEADGIRFEVDRLVVMERNVGSDKFFTTDYMLCDPTDENINAGIRAFDDGKGGVSLLLLRPDGDNPYDKDLEEILDSMKPGSTEGFPRLEDVYDGFSRPFGVSSRYLVRVNEYGKHGERKSYEKFYWDFVRDESLGDPVYLFEMSNEDGYFYTHFGRPMKSNLVRGFRF